jgi:hypothetical protein
VLDGLKPSEYFGRFWFAAEPIFGVVMTMVFLSILRNQALYAYPVLLDKVTGMVILAAITCCIAWGIVDGIFYAWENHSLAAKKNMAVSYLKNRQKEKTLEIIEENLDDSFVSTLDDNRKREVYDMVLGTFSGTETKERVPVKDDLITILLDMCLNLGACIIIVLPMILFQNYLSIVQLLNLSVVIAIVLLFIIGAWTETRKGLRLKVRKGGLYAVLGVIITVLTYLLGG